jgi:hypothetical protein
MSGKNLLKDESIAIVDDTGRLQAYFNGPFAKDEAREHMSATRNIKEYHGASIIEGKDAKTAIEKGRV